MNDPSLDSTASADLLVTAADLVRFELGRFYWNYSTGGGSARHAETCGCMGRKRGWFSAPNQCRPGGNSLVAAAVCVAGCAFAAAGISRSIHVDTLKLRRWRNYWACRSHRSTSTAS